MPRIAIGGSRHALPDRPASPSDDYNAPMSEEPARRIFSLVEAQELLPTVKAITAGTVTRAEALAAELQGRAESDPEHQRLAGELNDLIARWASRLRSLEVEVKGLWLVDFDNGEGYYCWSYPEDAITHFHGYDDGFAGRMKIL